MSPNLAVVSGSNGLLGLIQSNSNSNWSTDSPQTAPPLNLVRSHGGDVAITAVDFVLCDGADGCDITLASGDSDGTVCVWRVCASIGRGYLLHKPYELETEARRVFSLTLSPCGSKVAVGLCDRMQLLTFSRFENEGQNLLMECLDVCGDEYAIYSVSFDREYLRIWRVGRQESNENGIVVTTWQHNHQDYFKDGEDVKLISLAGSVVEVIECLDDGSNAVEATIVEPVTVSLLPTVNASVIRADDDIIIDHHARHASHFSAFGMHRPESPMEHRVLQEVKHLKFMMHWVSHEHSRVFLRVKPILAVLCVLHQQHPSMEFLASVLRWTVEDVVNTIRSDLQNLLTFRSDSGTEVVYTEPAFIELLAWLCSTDCER